MSVGKSFETGLTPASIEEVLKEASSSRWPMMVSLVESEGGLTATELAKEVGKSVGWTNRQAKAMKEEGILKSGVDPQDLPRGQVYSLAVEREVVEQLEGYKPAREAFYSKARKASQQQSIVDNSKPVMERLVKTMALDNSAIEWGFMPVSVVQLETDDGVEHVMVPWGELVTLTAEGFWSILEELRKRGESKPAPLTNQSEQPAPVPAPSHAPVVH